MQFCLQRHDRWRDERGEPFLTLPTKKTLARPAADTLDGRSLEAFVDAIMQQDLRLEPDDYVLDQELDAVPVEVDSPTANGRTHYEIFPVDVWVAPECRGGLPAQANGEWLAADAAAADPRVSPTSRAVFAALLERERALDSRYGERPVDEFKPEAPRRLLADVPDRPDMDALAKKWHARNRGGVRVLAWREIESILDAGNRAFNLLVADPYLRYQNQGFGLTWAFFTHKDGQDLHVHGAPTVEIYGVLTGRLEIWWKPYHDRGASAWSHRILSPLDWAEVGPLQCHIVRWLEEGIGVAVKAGPGPLAGVGALGMCGKTKCDNCPCRKPPEVVELEAISKVAPRHESVPTCPCRSAPPPAQVCRGT